MLFFTFDIRSPGSRLIPFIVGLGTLTLMLLLATMALSPRFASWYRQLEGRTAPSLSAVAPKDVETEQLKTRKKEITVVGWLLFLSATTYILGFLVAVPLFLFLFLKFWAKEKWSVSLGIPVAVSVAVYFIFVYILQIPLHEGIFFNIWY